MSGNEEEAKEPLSFLVLAQIGELAVGMAKEVQFWIFER